MLVRWNRTNVWSIGTGQMDGSVIQLIPGPNEITEDKWNLIKDNKVVKQRMETEIIDPKRGKVKMLEIIKPSKPESDEKSEDVEKSEDIEKLSIDGLSSKEAKEIIKETFNTKLLKTWQESESRSGVLKEIEKQLEKIESERIERESKEDS
jgi:hypothetical protein